MGVVLWREKECSRILGGRGGHGHILEDLGYRGGGVVGVEVGDGA